MGIYRSSGNSRPAKLVEQLRTSRRHSRNATKVFICTLGQLFSQYRTVLVVATRFLFILYVNLQATSFRQRFYSRGISKKIYLSIYLYIPFFIEISSAVLGNIQINIQPFVFKIIIISHQTSTVKRGLPHIMQQQDFYFFFIFILGKQTVTQKI